VSAVPASWMKVSLDEVAQWGSGGTPSRKNPDYFVGDIPWLKTGELGQKYIRQTEEKISQEAVNSSAAKLFPKGSVCIAMYGATIGKASILCIDATTNQACAVAQPLTGVLDAEFLYYFFISEKPRFIEAGIGGAQPNISQGLIKSWPFTLPPLAEQKRIVVKIEELFSELDAGEQSLRLARRQLGVYRQSLLKQAFEGKLTAQWRERTKTAFGWRYERFGAFITGIEAGKSFRCEERRPKPNEIGVAKVSAVTWGEYDEAESKTCVDPAKVNPAYFIRTGDFLISRANTIELVGACVIVRGVTQQVMLSDKTLRLHVDNEHKPFFLHYLRSYQGRREIEERSTGNQESMRNIGQESIRSIEVPVCPLPEQQEIVRLLDEQFEVIERNEREIDAALRRSEALRQAILKKAFTGQLVPQDSDDEPASVLLACIRAQKQPKPIKQSKKNA